MFSPAIDGSTAFKPDSVTQRYSRLVARLGIDSTLHALRHYSATELIAAGVDVRTVAGRLGHGGGGTTTLRVYTAWLSESDQRAASTLSARMPTRPTLPTPRQRKLNPFERIAEELRAAITSGQMALGDELPTVAEIAEKHCVSVGTAHRAVDC